MAKKKEKKGKKKDKGKKKQKKGKKKQLDRLARIQHKGFRYLPDRRERASNHFNSEGNSLKHNRNKQIFTGMIPVRPIDRGQCGRQGQIALFFC